MTTNYPQRAAAILQKVQYATIATSSLDHQPWNSPVAHYWDKELNLYWASDKKNQHSQNIRANEKVFIVIYDSTVPEGEGEGVYIEAKAYELNDLEEIRFARELKKGVGQGESEKFMGEGIRRVYKAIPQQVWMNDAEERDGEFVRDYRVEISLEELKTLFPD